MYRNTVPATSYRHDVIRRPAARKLVGKWEKRGWKAGKTFRPEETDNNSAATVPRLTITAAAALMRPLSALFFQVRHSW